jgi:hypothetical protein
LRGRRIPGGLVVNEAAQPLPMVAVIDIIIQIY